ncbi:MAG: DUF3160 domain-containing protein [Spirochaetales bacterium]|nr:DUF3160 domain-containing protein [Spirochaetales bacterium]
MKNTYLLTFLVFLCCCCLASGLFAQAVGDTNNDAAINIIDALLVAQFYVGLGPQGFYESAADVNDSGSIDIVDALMIARRYVGIIDSFPAEKWVRYQVAAEQTDIVAVTGSGGTSVTVTFTFNHGGYRVVEWGETVQSGSVFKADCDVEMWTGMSTQAMTTTANTYSLGALDPGDYSFTLMCWGEEVETLRFRCDNATPYQRPVNLEAVNSVEQLDGAAEDMLLTNGFVVLGSRGYDRLSSLYFSLFRLNTDVPVLITTDALLHIFHMVYDNLLKTMEKTALLPKMEQLIGLMTTEIASEYGRLEESPFLSEAARRLWVCFAVAGALIKGETSITGNGTEAIREDANLYLQKIYDHTLTEYYPGDDYTMYEPRGHYTEDPELEHYFRAVKWLGRRIFRVYDPVNVSDSEYECAGAAIMGFLLMNVKNGAHPLWEELYTLTSLLVDAADSITPVMVDDAMRHCFGDEYATQKYMLLERHENLAALRDELLSDRYPESEIIPVPLLNPGDLPKKYVQFMGERYVIDGEAMQRTCFPDVADRPLPGGLDVAAAVLNSPAAYEEMEGEMISYPGLKEAIDTLIEEFAVIPEEKWMRSTYNAWLYTLRSLSATPGGAAPECMKTSLWQREKLNTQMASWTQLRHDNILYAKQTMIPSPWNEGRGLVEPYPDFYLRLSRMCRSLVSVMDAFEIDLQVHRTRLQTLAGWGDSFSGYAEKIIAGTPLSADEQNRIKRWGLDLLSFFSSSDLPEDDPALVADVASSSITGGVLHEGVGNINPIIVIYTDPEDSVSRAALGYVLSHYEFIEEDWNRLNDEEWVRRLEEDPPARPPWTAGFIAK